MKQDTYNSMKRVSVNADQTQAFVIISSDGMVINASENAKNYIIKAYAIRDLFGILVVTSVNVINNVMLVNIQTMQVQKKKKVDKLVEECTENIDEVKIADENEYVCSYIICLVLVVITLAISIGIGA